MPALWQIRFADDAPSGVSIMRVVAMMAIYNEASRYLRRVLKHLFTLVDQVIVLDDCSTDEGPEICREFSKIHVFRPFNHRTEYQESDRWARLFQETAKWQPDWILATAADQILDTSPKDFHILLSKEDISCYCFSVYDMWTETHYREDEYWKSHKMCFARLMRFDPNRQYSYLEKSLHSQILPLQIGPCVRSDIRIKHLGFIRPEDRIERYRRNKEWPSKEFVWSDRSLRFREQIESMLDPEPNLVLYSEKRRLSNGLS